MLNMILPRLCGQPTIPDRQSNPKHPMGGPYRDRQKDGPSFVALLATLAYREEDE